VRGSVEAQLSASRAEVTTLTTQLAELRGSLAAARDSAVVAEAAAARLQEERVRLSKVCVAHVVEGVSGGVISDALALNEVPACTASTVHKAVYM
jgi:hypothetical protein